MDGSKILGKPPVRPKQPLQEAEALMVLDPHQAFPVSSNSHKSNPILYQSIGPAFKAKSIPQIDENAVIGEDTCSPFTPDCNENLPDSNNELLKRTKNSLEVPLEHDECDLDSMTDLEKYRQFKKEGDSPSCEPTRIRFDPDDCRVQRLDLLWRVQEGKPVDTGASVSDCTLLPELQEPEPEEPVPIPGSGLLPLVPILKVSKPLKGIQRDRNQIIPDLQKKRVRHLLDIKNPVQGSQSNLDKEGNIITSGKPEDEDGNGDNEGNRWEHQGQQPQAQAPRDRGEGLGRREPFTWPWHSGNYALNIRFINRQFRNQFSSRIILLKAGEWGFATLWTLAAKKIEFLQTHLNDLMWTVYFAIFLLLIIFLTVRSVGFVNNKHSVAIMIGYVLCISHISALFYLRYDDRMIPQILLTLTLSYSFLLGSCALVKERVDVDGALISYIVCIYNFVTSVLAFFLILLVRGESVPNEAGNVLGFWGPSCFISTTISIMEMVEIQAVLQGRRIPLEPNDWVLATTFVL